MKTLTELQREIGAWGDSTFPASTYQTVVAHFEEEASEFVAAVKAGDAGAFEEAADCFLLLLHFCHKSGVDLETLAEAKMTINRARIWKTTPEPAGHVKHEVLQS